MEARKKFVQRIAANIRSVRQSKRYTQEYIANQLSISQNAYSKIELADSKLTVDRLIKIAVLLECRVADLMSPELIVKIVPKESRASTRSQISLRKAHRKDDI